MRITTTQLNPKPGDLKHNFNQMLDMILEAVERKSELIVFPELSLTGYDTVRNFHKIPIKEDSQIIKDFATLASCYNIVIVFGSLLLVDDLLYNGSFIIDTNKKVSIVKTMKITSNKTNKYFEESRYFEPNREINPIETTLGKMGILICYDIFTPDFPSLLKERGAQFFVVITGLPKIQKDVLESLLLVRSLENSLPLIYSNLVGPDRDKMYCGGSCIIQKNPNGELPTKSLIDTTEIKPKMLTALLHV